MLRSIAGALLRRVGYQAVRVDALPSINIALHLRRILQSQQIDTVLDVGANRGQYRDFLREQVGFRGRILSFEPISRLNRALSHRAESDPQWHIYPYAIGDIDDTLSINVMVADDFSSFLAPTTTGTERFRESNSVATTEAVRMRRLDEVYPEMVHEHRIGAAYLKLDTQGFDLHALRGGSKVLREIVGIQTEVSVIPLYQGMPSYRDMIDYLHSFGFDLAGLFPVTYDEKLRLIEFDCMLLNASRITPLAVQKR